MISWRPFFTLFTVALVMTAAANGCAAAAAFAGRERWPTGSVVRVAIDARMAPRSGAELVERAMKTWTEAAAGGIRLDKAGAGDVAPLRVRFVRSDWNYGETRPKIDPRSGAIVAADVAINADVLGDVLQQRIIVYLTALHELGHALGLPHTDDFATIMYSFRRPDDGTRYFAAYRQRLRNTDDIGSPHATGLAAADVAAIRSLYSRSGENP